MKTIYFVRHGECQANLDGVISGSRNDSPLTDLGCAQAGKTAKKFAGKPVDLVVASPLSRAKGTARIIADGIGYKGEIRIEPLLTERDFGTATGQPLDVGFAALDAGQVVGAETLEALAERMRRVLDLFAALPGQQILVVGSSGAERMLRTVYNGKTHEGFFETEPLRNGEVREYEIDA